MKSYLKKAQYILVEALATPTNLGVLIAFVVITSGSMMAASSAMQDIHDRIDEVSEDFHALEERYYDLLEYSIIRRR